MGSPTRAAQSSGAPGDLWHQRSISVAFRAGRVERSARPGGTQRIGPARRTAAARLLRANAVRRSNVARGRGFLGTGRSRSRSGTSAGTVGRSVVHATSAGSPFFRVGHNVCAAVGPQQNSEIFRGRAAQQTLRAQNDGEVLVFAASDA